MLSPTSHRRERILLYGAEGTGKTRTWCTIAAWLRRTKSPARCYVLDSDVTTEAMADGWEDFYDNVESYDVASFTDWKDGLRKFQEESDPTRGDWLIPDSGDKLWSAAQDYFIEVVKEQEVVNWVLEHARGDKAGQHPLSGEWGMNWYYINKIYMDVMGPIIRWKGHVLVCCPEKQLIRAQKPGDRSDDKDVIALFDRYNMRPEGQKSLGHQMHTVIRTIDASSRGNLNYQMTTVKDREREKMNAKKIEDFVTDYLVPVAKWQI